MAWAPHEPLTLTMPAGDGVVSQRCLAHDGEAWRRPPGRRGGSV